MTFLSKFFLLWFALLAVFSTSVTLADVVGTHHVKGTLDVTFSKQKQISVKTVAELDEIWTINADHSFSRGTINGKWQPRKDGNIEINAFRDDLTNHLTSYWNDLGVVVDNLRISKYKVVLQEVANGLSIEETLVYNMDVAENGGTGNMVPAKVTVRGNYSSIADNADTLAMQQMFPLLQHASDYAALIGPTSSVLGYSFYVPGKISATKEFYLFEYTDASGNVTEAFACFCQKRSDGTSYWQGSGSSTCNTPNSGAKAIPPNSILIPSAYRLSISTMPSGACCLSQPKDANGNIPGLPVPVPGNDNCFF